MNDISTILSQSSLQSAQQAAQAIRDGGDATPVRENNVEYLLDLYTLRLNRLKTHPGAHAAKLAAEVAEMLENLCVSSTVQTTVIQGPGELIFYIFLTDSASRAIGCMSGVDRRKVSNDQWNKLWERAF